MTYKLYDTIDLLEQPETGNWVYNLILNNYLLRKKN